MVTLIEGACYAWFCVEPFRKARIDTAQMSFTVSVFQVELLP